MFSFKNRATFNNIFFNYPKYAPLCLYTFFPSHMALKLNERKRHYVNGLLSYLTYNKKNSVIERSVGNLDICMQVTSYYNEQL